MLVQWTFFRLDAQGGVWVLLITSLAWNIYHKWPTYAVVTPLRKAASYEPRIANLWIWGDTFSNSWQIRHLQGGSYGALMGSKVGTSCWKVERNFKMFTQFCHVKSALCRVSYVAVTRIPSLVLRNTWHYIIIRRQKFWFPKFVLRCSYEATLRKGVTTALWASSLYHAMSKYLCSNFFCD